MEPNRIKTTPPETGTPPPPEQVPSGQFLGRSVKVNPGKKIVLLCFSFIKRLFSGFSLRERTAEKRQSNEQQFIKGEYWEQVPLPATVEQRQQILVHSALAQLPYLLNSNPVQAWDTVKEAENFAADPASGAGVRESSHQLETGFFQQLIHAQQGVKDPQDTAAESVLTDAQKQLAQNTLFKHMVLLPSGMLIDRKSGLTAVMVVNRATKNITLVFGGTLSGYGATTLLDETGKKAFRQTGRTLAQIRANIANVTGLGIPTCYRQAEQLTALVKSMMASEEVMENCQLQDSKWLLSLAGHSLGGGLVQYASAKNKVPGHAFSSAALGKKVLQDLSRDEKELARGGLVMNYLIENDPVNTPLGYRFLHKKFTPTLIGKRLIIEGQRGTGKNNLYGRHSWSHSHYSKAFREQRRV